MSDTPLFDAMCSAYGIIGDRPEAIKVREAERELNILRQQDMRFSMREPAALRSQLAAAQAVIAQMREALDIASDLAGAEAARVHDTFKGYKPHKHKAVDDDVAKVNAAIAMLNSPSSALEAERKKAKREALEEVLAEWEAPYDVNKGKFIDRLRRMIDELGTQETTKEG